MRKPRSIVRAGLVISLFLPFLLQPAPKGFTSALPRLQTSGGAPQDPYTSSVEIEAKPAGDDFLPDADLEKRVWRRAEWVEFDHNMPGTQHYSEEKTRVAALWSETFVYFAFLCHYTVLNTFEGENINAERWELWTRDVAEVFLNPQPARVSHYFEFEVAPNNQWIDLEIDKDKTPFNDAAWNSGFAHAAGVDQAHRLWTCEMRIPVASLNVAVMPPGREWRVNFFRAAGVGDDTKRRFMAWSTIPTGDTFHVPTRFGIMRFVK
jgi:hypothetical protein